MGGRRRRPAPSNTDADKTVATVETKAAKVAVNAPRTDGDPTGARSGGNAADEAASLSHKAVLAPTVAFENRHVVCEPCEVERLATRTLHKQCQGAHRTRGHIPRLQDQRHATTPKHVMHRLKVAMGVQWQEPTQDRAK